MSDDRRRAYDVVVVGAGIVGVSTAYDLARSGLSVAVFDRGAVAAEQSSRAWGFLRQQGRHSAELLLADQATALWTEITDTFGIEGTRIVRAGILVPAETDADERFLRNGLEAAARHGLATELIGARDIARLLPELAGPWRCALYTPSDGHGDPRTSSLTIARGAEAAGAHIFPGEAVVDFETAKGRLSGVRTASRRCAAGAVVLASRIGSPRLAARLGVNLPVQTIRSSVARTTQAAPFTRIALWGPKVAFRPEHDGRFVLGNGYRGVGTDYDLTLDSLRNLRYFLPALRRNLAAAAPATRGRARA